MRHSFLKKIQAVTKFNLWDTFCENDDGHAGDRRNILLGNFLSGMLNAITNGVYFTGLMLAMGASETYVGYVAAVISFCGFFQILSPLLLEGLPRRKALLLTAKVVHLLLNTVVIGVIPLLPIGNIWKLALFMTTLIVVHITNAIMQPGITAWHLQSIPQSKRVDFYAANNLGVTLLSQISALLAGVFLDKMELEGWSLGAISPTLTAILILRLAALLLGSAECFCFCRVQEDSYTLPTEKKNRFHLLLTPMKDRVFLRTISNQVFWSVSVTLVGQYFSIYLLEDVQMSYSLISLGGFLSMPLALLATPIWARAMRNKDWMQVLLIAQLGTMVAYVMNAFITPDTLYIYFLCILCGGTFNPGVNIAYSNLLYRDMPEANRTAYISLHAILLQLANFLGNSTGIWFITNTRQLRLPVLGFLMGNKQYINLLTAAIMLLIALYTQASRSRRQQKRKTGL